MPKKSIKAIIVGSARGVSHLDINKSHPASMTMVTETERALDWILEDLNELGITDISYIGGHHIEKVIQNYPGLQYFYDPSWAKNDFVSSLNCAAGILEGSCLIISSDLLLRAEALRSMLASRSEIVIGMDESTANKKTFLLKLLKTNPQGSRTLKRWLNSNAKGQGRNLSSMVRKLQIDGCGVDHIPIASQWASLEDATALARFVLGTKAQTLDRLKNKIKNAVILDQVSFTVRRWKMNPHQVCVQIQKKFKGGLLAVRSCALSEDGWTHSNAGRFHSVLNVNGADKSAIFNAVEKVIDSYNQAGAENPENQILVQPQVLDVAYSGVLLTRDLESGAPYYLINGSRSSRSDDVTSGAKSHLDTIFVYKHAVAQHHDPLMARLIRIAKEVEKRIGHDCLDIEFCIDKKGEVFLLQVRPLVAKNPFKLADSDFAEEISQVRRFLSGFLEKNSGLLPGRRTVLGVMPDWNPAEMIGTCPHPLSLSLYQRLITDRGWSLARSLSGYHDVWPEPLVVALAGRPYVDVRVSLNSFLPKDTPADLAAKLVDAQLDTLTEHPEFHDKIEFEIAATCMDFDFNRYQKIFEKAGLTGEEVAQFRTSLLKLTDNILMGQAAGIEDQLSQLEDLEKSRTKIMNQASGSDSSTLPRVIWNLHETCIRHGIVPFSILARYCFISMSILRSLKKQGVFSAQELEEILTGIPTVASEIKEAVAKRSAGLIDNAEFIAKYGHLRPGSYNIASSSYAQAVDRYFPPETLRSPTPGQEDAERARRLFDSKRKVIEVLLEEHGFECGFDQLREFIFKSIPGREFAKFEFMKNVNAILELISRFGESLGLSRERMSFISIEPILRLATDSPSCAIQMELDRLSGFAAKRYELTRSMRMPHIIDSSQCLDTFKMLPCRPNFITTKSVTAPLTALGPETDQLSLAGKIVLIEGADPGYDWLFTHKIAGLITVYGGVASHMAIRAAEFGLPSAIGCGELIYEDIRHAKVVELDCAAQMIRRVDS